MRLKIALTLAFLLLCATVVLSQTQSTGAVNEHQGVVDTIHDINGVADEACLNCHSVHAARTDGVLLWARALTGVTFNTYDSASLTVTGGNPLAVSGAAQEEWGSLLCLSCHDDAGVNDEAGVLVGGNRLGGAATATFPGLDAADVASATIFPVRNNALPTTPPLGVAGVTTFTTNQLQTDHPVNLDYVPGPAPGNVLLESVTDAEGAGVKFYDTSGDVPTVQCGSCHNPHEVNYLESVGPGTNWENRTYFIRAQLGRGEELCLACHL
jgi:hypothetical protein